MIFETLELNASYNIYVSKVNGNNYALPNFKFGLVDETNERLNFNQEIELPSILLPENYKVIYISLHASTQCNMSCTYCFLTDRKSNCHINFDMARNFIDYIIDKYPHADKYIVDPTGSGEPLLRVGLITQIGEYCKVKSDEINKEVLPMLVCNGTLLNDKIVDKLRNAGILFGVSIDGTKKAHDANRIDHKNKGTYKVIIDNVKAIKDKTLLGAATTLNAKNTNLVETLKHLNKYFPTVSIKSVRSNNPLIGINKTNINTIKEEYERLFRFVLKKTLRGNLSYVSSLLNGDDYWGKFLVRVILNQKIITRCDAGVGRYSLASDGKIYACPAAIGIKELEIGDNLKGIDLEKQKKIANTLLNKKKCNGCIAKYVCGGECMITSFYSKGLIDSKDEIMCEFKRHLFHLALKFKYNLMLKNKKYYQIIYDGCIEKVNRFKNDDELYEVLIKSKQYSFTELKRIKDTNIDEFKNIKNKLWKDDL